MRRPTTRPEEILHRAVAQYLDRAMPLASWWTSVPNQRGTRKRFEMGILKGLGVKAGVPDIIALHNGRFFGIELKSPKGIVSDNQESTHRQIELSGGATTVARTVEDVEMFLREYGVPLRATVLPDRRAA